VLTGRRLAQPHYVCSPVTAASHSFVEDQRRRGWRKKYYGHLAHALERRSEVCLRKGNASSSLLVRAKLATCVFRRKLSPISRERTARSCCNVLQRRSRCLTGHMQEDRSFSRNLLKWGGRWPRPLSYSMAIPRGSRWHGTNLTAYARLGLRMRVRGLASKSRVGERGCGSRVIGTSLLAMTRGKRAGLSRLRARRSRRRLGDQARAALAGEIGPDPLALHAQPILELRKR
jgi:hypothetical protein